MKHTLLYIGLALASFMMQPAAVQAKARKEAKVVKQLVVLHTNDTHSCVMPINPNLADTATANRGGFLRRVAMINQGMARYYGKDKIVASPAANMQESPTMLLETLDFCNLEAEL